MVHVLFRISVGASLTLRDTEERTLSRVVSLSDAAYCRDAMCVRTRLNGESAEHCARLEDLLSGYSLDERSLESFEGKSCLDQVYFNSFKVC